MRALLCDMIARCICNMGKLILRQVIKEIVDVNTKIRLEEV